MPKKTILIVYEYFFPGYRAGGPIQSLVNMVLALQHVYTFKVITTAYDMHTTKPYPNIQLNSWNTVQLAPKTQPIEVWYSATPKISIGTFKKAIQQSSASIIYINGLFTQWFTQPLILKKSAQLKGVEIIICPRGMLQAGALSVKPFKKKLFLSAFKKAQLFKGVRWHATNEEEANDIQKNIHSNARSLVAYNIPKPPVSVIQPSTKQVGKLSLVYLSLITQKKNLLLLLEVLKNCTANIELAIYGPIKDIAYWQQCELLMQQMPHNINISYKGDVQPFEVQNTIAQYDAFILLTKGENFGHALFEALSCGRPIITSFFTPWNELEKQRAGWNIDINNNENIQLLLQQIAMIDATDFASYCDGAWQIAKDYYHQSSFHKNYCTLFSS
ncbi:MAG: glycosyltransferase [Chitinophagaceae bacterium]|jgi:glycosyltransferase involved in cell wall biosynthesis|nr:glycosyltransferase [Chitinophagaceae bacterium]